MPGHCRQIIGFLDHFVQEGKENGAYSFRKD